MPLGSILVVAAAVWAGPGPAPAEAASFTGLGGGADTAYASAVSGDGGVIAGINEEGTAGFRWTETGGVEILAFQPADVSADGGVIVGTRGFFEAVRWSEETGVVGLDDLTPGGPIYSLALAVSADGSVVVGATADEPFVWTAPGPMSAAPPVPQGAYNGKNVGVSADGMVIAGTYQIDVPAPPPQNVRTETHAYRAVDGLPDEIAGILLGAGSSALSADGEVVVGQVANQAAFWRDGNVSLIGALSGYLYSFAEGTSASGDCIVGTSQDGMGTFEAMLWNDVQGLRRLRDVLEDLGLGAELAGWTLTQANDVSDDCTTVVGTGIDPGGSPQAWVVRGFEKGTAPARCAQPVSDGPAPIASDCLFILNVAVGLFSCPLECVCAPKGSLPAAATDALVCLSAAVGAPANLDCPCGG